MKLHTQQYGNGDAVMVTRQGDQALLDLPVDQIKDLMRSHGAVMFRGFESGPDLMKAFANQFSYKFNRDRLRPTVDGTGGHVQMVNEGMGYVDPHCEQANSPFRPDAIWFSCTRPAAEGGETLFWDGLRLWGLLDDDLKRMFRAKRLRFFQRYEKEKWRLFLGPESTREDIASALSGVAGVSYFVSPEEHLYLEYVCSPVVRTRFGDKEAFANSLMSEWRNTLGELMTFEDGEEISRDIIDRIQTSFDACVEAIDWKAGDLVFLDNSRYLHGRNPFADASRKVYSSLSFLNF